MVDEIISRAVPATLLLVLGIIEAFGGLYFEDKRTKNDFSIELVSLVTLPILIQPAIFLFIFWIGDICFAQYENSLVELAIWWQILAFLVFDFGVISVFFFVFV